MKKLLFLLLAIITCDSFLVISTLEVGSVIPTLGADQTIYTIRKDGKIIYQEQGVAGKYPVIYDLAKSLVETQGKVSVLEKR